MASESMVESNLLQSAQILFMADLDIPESHDMFTPKQNISNMSGSKNGLQKMIWCFFLYEFYNII